MTPVVPFGPGAAVATNFSDFAYTPEHVVFIGCPSTPSVLVYLQGDWANVTVEVAVACDLRLTLLGSFSNVTLSIQVHHGGPPASKRSVFTACGSSVINGSSITVKLNDALPQPTVSFFGDLFDSIIDVGGGWLGCFKFDPMEGANNTVSIHDISFPILDDTGYVVLGAMHRSGSGNFTVSNFVTSNVSAPPTSYPGVLSASLSQDAHLKIQSVTSHIDLSGNTFGDLATQLGLFFIGTPPEATRSTVEVRDVNITAILHPEADTRMIGIRARSGSWLLRDSTFSLLPSYTTVSTRSFYRPYFAVDSEECAVSSFTATNISVTVPPSMPNEFSGALQAAAFRFNTFTITDPEGGDGIIDFVYKGVLPVFPSGQSTADTHMMAVYATDVLDHGTRGGLNVTVTFDPTVPEEEHKAWNVSVKVDALHGRLSVTAPRLKLADIHGVAANPYLAFDNGTASGLSNRSGRFELRASHIEYVNVTGPVPSGECTPGSGTRCVSDRSVSIQDSNITGHCSFAFLGATASAGEVVLSNVNVSGDFLAGKENEDLMASIYISNSTLTGVQLTHNDHRHFSLRDSVVHGLFSLTNVVGALTITGSAFMEELRIAATANASVLVDDCRLRTIMKLIGRNSSGAPTGSLTVSNNAFGWMNSGRLTPNPTLSIDGETEALLFPSIVVANNTLPASSYGGGIQITPTDGISGSVLALARWVFSGNVISVDTEEYGIQVLNAETGQVESTIITIRDNVITTPLAGHGVHAHTLISLSTSQPLHLVLINNTVEALTAVALDSPSLHSISLLDNTLKGLDNSASPTETAVTIKASDKATSVAIAGNTVTSSQKGFLTKVAFVSADPAAAQCDCTIRNNTFISPPNAATNLDTTHFSVITDRFRTVYLLDNEFRGADDMGYSNSQVQAPAQFTARCNKEMRRGASELAPADYGSLKASNPHFIFEGCDYGCVPNECSSQSTVAVCGDDSKECRCRCPRGAVVPWTTAVGFAQCSPYDELAVPSAVCATTTASQSLKPFDCDFTDFQSDARCTWWYNTTDKNSFPTDSQCVYVNASSVLPIPGNSSNPSCSSSLTSLYVPHHFAFQLGGQCDHASVFILGEIVAPANPHKRNELDFVVNSAYDITLEFCGRVRAGAIVVYAGAPAQRRILKIQGHVEEGALIVIPTDATIVLGENCSFFGDFKSLDSSTVDIDASAVDEVSGTWFFLYDGQSHRVNFVPPRVGWRNANITIRKPALGHDWKFVLINSTLTIGEKESLPSPCRIDATEESNVTIIRDDGDAADALNISADTTSTVSIDGTSTKDLHLTVLPSINDGSFGTVHCKQIAVGPLVITGPALNSSASMASPTAPVGPDFSHALTTAQSPLLFDDCKLTQNESLRESMLISGNLSGVNITFRKISFGPSGTRGAAEDQRLLRGFIDGVANGTVTFEDCEFIINSWAWALPETFANAFIIRNTLATTVDIVSSKIRVTLVHASPPGPHIQTVHPDNIFPLSFWNVTSSRVTVQAEVPFLKLALSRSGAVMIEHAEASSFTLVLSPSGDSDNVLEDSIPLFLQNLDGNVGSTIDLTMLECPHELFRSLQFGYNVTSFSSVRLHQEFPCRCGYSDLLEPADEGRPFPDGSGPVVTPTTGTAAMAAAKLQRELHRLNVDLTDGTVLPPLPGHDGGGHDTASQTGETMQVTTPFTKMRRSVKRLNQPGSGSGSGDDVNETIVYVGGGEVRFSGRYKRMEMRVFKHVQSVVLDGVTMMALDVKSIAFCDSFTISNSVAESITDRSIIQIRSAESVGAITIDSVAVTVWSTFSDTHGIAIGTVSNNASTAVVTIRNSNVSATASEAGVHALIYVQSVTGPRSNTTDGPQGESVTRIDIEGNIITTATTPAPDAGSYTGIFLGYQWVLPDDVAMDPPAWAVYAPESERAVLRIRRNTVNIFAHGGASPRSSAVVIRGANVSSALLSENDINVTWVDHTNPPTAITASGVTSQGIDVEVIDNTLKIGPTDPPSGGGSGAVFVDFGVEPCSNASVFSSRNTFEPSPGTLDIPPTSYYNMSLSSSCTVTVVEDAFVTPNVSAPPPVIVLPENPAPPGVIRIKSSTVVDSSDPTTTRNVTAADLPPGADFVSASDCFFRDICGPATVGLARCLGPETVAASSDALPPPREVLCMCRCADGLVTNNTVPSLQCTADEPASDRYRCERASLSLSLLGTATQTTTNESIQTASREHTKTGRLSESLGQTGSLQLTLSGVGTGTLNVSLTATGTARLPVTTTPTLAVTATHSVVSSRTATANSTATASRALTLSGSVSISKTSPVSASKTLALEFFVKRGPSTLPGFYLLRGSSALRFVIARGSGVSALRPLRFSVITGSPRPIAIRRLEVAQTTSAFDRVSVNGRVFSTQLIGAAPTDSCGSLRQADVATGAALSDMTLSITAGPAFEVSCDPSVFFSGVVSYDDLTVLRRSVVVRPATIRSAATAELNIGNVSASTTVHRTSAVQVRTSLVPQTINAPALSATVETFDVTVANAAAAAPRLGTFNSSDKATSLVVESIHCGAADMDAFEATHHHIGLGVAMSCRTTEGAPCRTMVEYQQRCAADPECAGFTVAVTSDTNAALDSSNAADSVYAEVPVIMHAVSPTVSVSGSPAAVSEEISFVRLLQLRDTIPERPFVVESAFYRRVPTAERTCQVAVAGHGKVRVLLQQTSLAEASVDVFVKTAAGHDLRKGRCGGSDLFASSRAGQSGACGLFLECTDLEVSPGDVVSIVPQTGINQFGCNESLGALLLFFDSGPVVTPSPGGPARFTGHNVTGFSSRSLGARSSIIDNAAIAMLNFPVFTFAAQNVTLRVAQTRFACATPGDGTGDTAPACPTTDPITIATGAHALPQSQRSCGGLGGFPELGDALKGYTGQCQVEVDCADTLLSPQSPVAAESGLWAQRTIISVDPSMLRASPVQADSTGSLCSAFAADLFLEDPSGPGSSSLPPLFPLWCRGSTDRVKIGGGDGIADGSLCPALLLPSAVAQSALNEGAGALRNTTLQALLTGEGFRWVTHPALSPAAPTASQAPAATLALSTLRDARNSENVAVYVDWSVVQDRTVTPRESAAVQSVEFAQTLLADTTFACLMDTAPTSGIVTCVVAIPANATAATVDVLQTDFAENTVEVAFVAADGSIVDGGTTTCGGAELFFGQRGQASQCDSYLPCRQGFIPGARLGATDSGRPVSLRITVPENLANGPCDWALAAIVTFSSPRVPPICDLGKEFTCASDAICIPRTAVCDGIPNDCGDNSDEAQCRFTLVDRGFTPNASIVAVSFPAITAYTECLRETVVIGARAFFLDDVIGCMVINSTNTVAMISAPSEYTVPQEGERRRGELHVATPLVTPLSEYQRCSAVLHCADRGFVTDEETCACRCITSYTGTNCETLVQSGAVVTYVAVVNRTIAQSGNASAIPLNILRGALAPSTLFPAVQITTVSQPLSYDDDHVAFPFTADSENRPALVVFLARIFTAATLEEMNKVLRPATGIDTTIKFVFGIDAPNEFRDIGFCHTNATGTVSQCPTPPFGQGALLLTATGLSDIQVATESTEADAMKVVAADSSVTQHRSVSALAAASPNLQCVGSAVSFGDTTANARCIPRTCMLSPDANSTVNITRALDISGAVVDSGCSAPSVAISTAQLVSQPPAVEPSEATVSQSATEGFVLATIVAGGAVFLLLIGVSAAAVIFGVSLRNAATTIAGRSTARRDAWLLARESMGRVCGRESFISAVIAFIVIFGLCAGFFTVLYIHSRYWGSNAAVVIELFQTSQCGGQLLKTLPLSMTVIEATGRCEALSVTGRSVGALFGAAECIDADGGKIPRVRIARTLAECRSSDLLSSVTPHVCVNFASILPDTASPFAVASCATNSAAQDRSKSLAIYNPVELLAEQVAVTHDSTVPITAGADLPTQASRRVPILSTSSDGLYPALYQDGYTQMRSTSHTIGTVASVATTSKYVGGYEAMRLLVQDDNAFDAARTTPQVSSMERLYQPNLTRLDQSTAALARFVPKDDDYPVGFVFSGFGSSAEISGDAAGLGAQRYRGVRSTAFDVGHQFEPDPTKARLAVTISFWMRATTSAQGFVFAVTDDYEDTHDRLSPVMTRLLKVAASGDSGTVPWFTQDWHAYSALYIDGASQSLTFLFADPSDELAALSSNGFAGLAAGARDQDVPVARAQWDLPSMNEGSVFNGAWHKVSVALRNDEGRFFAVIAIDGRSSLSDSRWRKCLPRRPQPIVESLGTARGGRVNVTDANRAAVSNGGVLYVGHFNGAVRGLKVERAYDGAAGDVRTGTRALRIHAALPHRTGIEAVGVFLLVSALFTFLHVLVSAGLIVKHKRAAEAANEVESQKTFERQAASVFTSEFVALPFALCVAWLDVTPRALMQIHEELSDSPTTLNGRVKIIIALWTARHAQLKAERSAKTLGTIFSFGGSTRQAKPEEEEGEPHRDSSSFEVDEPEYPTPEEWRAFLESEGVVMPSPDAATDDVQLEGSGDMTKKNVDRSGTAGKTNNAAPVNANDNTNAAPQSNVNVGTNNNNNQTTRAPQGNNAGDQNDASESARRGTTDSIEADLQIGGEQISAIALATLGTLQAAAVYVTSFATVPTVYDANIGELFGFLTLGFDFFQTWIDDPLAGAMAQGLAVIVILVAVACVLANDDRRFYGTVLRYRTRRDTLLLAEEENADVAELTVRVQRMLAAVDPYFDPTGSTAPFSELHAVHVLRPEERCAVSEFLKTAEGEDRIGVTAREGHAHIVATEKAPLCNDWAPARTFPGELSGESTGADDGNATAAGKTAGDTVDLSDVGVTFGAFNSGDDEAGLQESASRGGGHSMTVSESVAQMEATHLAAFSSFALPQAASAASVAFNASLARQHAAAPSSAASQHPTLHVNGHATAGPTSAASATYNYGATGGIYPSHSTPFTRDQPSASWQRPQHEQKQQPAGLHLRYIGSRSVDGVRRLRRRSAGAIQLTREEADCRAASTADGADAFDNGIFEDDHVDRGDANTNAGGDHHDHPEQHQRSGASGHEEAEAGDELRTTGHTCVRHDRWLVTEEYTEVYPYYNRRRCCAVTDGKPCGKDIGAMRCCPDPECGFALCPDHVRPTGVTGVVMQLHAATSRFTQNGVVWFLEFVVLALALALYTPALRTCVMIVGCHPVYQCEFGDCWSYPTQRFAAAAYLAIVVLVLYGALFPLAFLALLYARYRTLRQLFARPSYGGRYLEPVPAGDTPQLNAEMQQMSAVVTLTFAIMKATTVAASAARSVRRRWNGNGSGENSQESACCDPANSPVQSDDVNGHHTRETPDDQNSTLAAARHSFLLRWLVPSGGATKPTNAACPYGATHLEDAVHHQQQHQTANGSEGMTESVFGPVVPPFALDVSQSQFYTPASPPAVGMAGSVSGSSVASPAGPMKSRPRPAMLVPIGGPLSPDGLDQSRRSTAGSPSGATKPASPLSSSVTSPKSLRLRQLRSLALGHQMSKRHESMSLRSPDDLKPTSPESLAAELQTVTVRAELTERLDTVDAHEWHRFLVSDRSVMAKLYMSVPVERLGAVPILSVAKFLLLIPPLLLEPSSAMQFLFIALGEVGFAVGFVLAEPYTSPWVTVTTLAGSVHQFIVVALQALLTARANDVDLAHSTGILMTIATFGYIAFVLVVVGAVLVHGIVATKIHQALSKSFFNRFDIARPATEPVYLCPVNDLGQGPVDTYVVEKDPEPEVVEAVVDPVDKTAYRENTDGTKASPRPRRSDRARSVVLLDEPLTVSAPAPVDGADIDASAEPQAGVGLGRRSSILSVSSQRGGNDDDDEEDNEDKPREFPSASGRQGDRASHVDPLVGVSVPRSPFGHHHAQSHADGQGHDGLGMSWSTSRPENYDGVGDPNAAVGGDRGRRSSMTFGRSASELSTGSDFGYDSGYDSGCGSSLHRSRSMERGVRESRTRPGMRVTRSISTERRWRRRASGTPCIVHSEGTDDNAALHSADEAAPTM